MPIAYAFPNAGKLLSLLFVPYGAWLAGSPLEASRYPEFLATGLIAFFARAEVALPFLFDAFGIPRDYFQLFIPANVLLGRFDSIVMVMAIFAFALLGASASTGRLQWKPIRAATRAATAGAAIFAGVAGKV